MKISNLVLALTLALTSTIAFAADTVPGSPATGTDMSSATGNSGDHPNKPKKSKKAKKSHSDMKAGDQANDAGSAPRNPETMPSPALAH
jgi:hypothetical protein